MSIPKQIEDLFILFKLVNGESIIGTIMSDDDDAVIARDVFQIITLVKQNDKGGLDRSTYYTEWFFSSESRVNLIRKSHIISAAVPDKKVREQYGKLLMKAEEDEKARKKANTHPNSKFKWDDMKVKWDDLKFKLDPKSDRMNN
jgi:hypothetical protein